MFDNQIICPVCGDNFVHIEACRYKNGEDEGKAWEGRGDAIESDMWCENEHHKWKMILGFHKGNTYIFNKVTEEKENNVLVKIETV